MNKCNNIMKGKEEVETGAVAPPRALHPVLPALAEGGKSTFTPAWAREGHLSQVIMIYNKHIHSVLVGHTCHLSTPT